MENNVTSDDEFPSRGCLRDCGPVYVIQGTTVAFRCSALESKPAVSIIWQLGDESLQSGDEYMMNGNRGLVDVFNVINLDITQDHHGDVLMCTAVNPISGDFRQTEVTLHVLSKIFIELSDSVSTYQTDMFKKQMKAYKQYIVFFFSILMHSYLYNKVHVFN